MEVKDVLGLSEPICKLIDVFSNGISALSAPWMYKRMEKAKAQMLLENSNQNREIALKDALAEQLKDELLTGRDKREMKNIADVLGLSAGLVSALPKVSEESVNPDWSARFFDYVKNCSDDDVKQIWSRILAGEIQTLGSYSYRTLDALRSISKVEAELLVIYADRVIMDGVMSKSLPVFDITRMADAGFIGETELTRTLSFGNSANQIIYTNEDFLILANKASLEETKYAFYPLTQVGRELYPLVSIGDGRETAFKVLGQCKNNFSECTFSVHAILARNGEKITYRTIPEE